MKTTRLRTNALLLLSLTIVAPVPAQQDKETGWDEWRPLLGKWNAEGGGQPGTATAGGFSFDFDLQGKVIVRRNYSEYPATGTRPASRHDDLMVIYRDPAKGTRAVYFDNEGHIIHYTVSFSEDRNTITFTSDVNPSEPRFRFIYTRQKEDTLSLEFDIAPPGKPDSFTKYVEGTARRQR